MVDTLLFVHAEANSAEQLADEYRGRGWDVSATTPDAPDALDRVAEAAPVAAVFCLDGECAADVSAFAEKVLADQRIRRPLMVFVGGAEDDVGKVRASMPFGVFVRLDELPWVLKRLTITS